MDIFGRWDIIPSTTDCVTEAFVLAFLELVTATSLSQALSVQFSHSVMFDSLRPHELQHARPPLSITNSWSSLRLTSIKSVMPSSHLILCHPLLLLPPIPPSISLFQCRSFKISISTSFPNQRLMEELDAFLTLNRAPRVLS